MRFLLLGPFAVVDGDRTATVGKGNERALIALLALHANTVVSTDRIIDGMWGDRPPATARDMVRLYVSRARRRIGDSLVTEGNGYLLRAENGAVDVSELERLRRAGTDAFAVGDAAAAVTFLSGAVELVRGEPLAEFAEFPFAREEIPRLEELRLGTTEDYYETLLTVGEAAELVPALEQLVEENPYRERLRGQLMLALYRAGRQTDALARYQEGRRLLADEVGIEPSPRLRELERAILQHDVDLAPIRRPNGDGAPEAAARRRPHHRSRWIAAPVALLALGVGIGAFVLTTQSGSAGPTLLPQNSVGVVDPSSGRIEHIWALHGVPKDVTGSTGRVWVALGEPHEIVEIDPSRPKPVKTIPLTSGPPRRIGSAAGGVWVDDSYSGRITRVDGATGVLGKPEQLFSPTRLSFARGHGKLWVAGGQSGMAVSVNPRTGRVIHTVRGLDSANAIATGFGALWLAASNRAEVQRVRGRRIGRSPIGSPPVAVATGSGAVWAVTKGGKLWGIDPKTLGVKQELPVGSDPTSVAVGGGSVWVASDQRHTLLRISPRKNRIVKRIPMGWPINALSYYDHRLWVAAA